MDIMTLKWVLWYPNSVLWCHNIPLSQRLHNTVHRMKTVNFLSSNDKQATVLHMKLNKWYQVISTYWKICKWDPWHSKTSLWKVFHEFELPQAMCTIATDSLWKVRANSDWSTRTRPVQWQPQNTELVAELPKLDFFSLRLIEWQSKKFKGNVLNNDWL